MNATTAPSRRRPPRATAGARVPAEVLPVARVLVDVSLAHLDRPYDYLVAEPDSMAAQPGVRVRVRFAGRLVNGFVLRRLAASEHQGRLGFLERVVSAEPVLTAEVAELARVVAERYAGTTADVLRLAVPPRHAKVEVEREAAESAAAAALVGDAALVGAAALVGDAALVGAAAPGTVAPDDQPVRDSATPAGGWLRYPQGAAFLGAIRERRAARAVWQALPGEDWPARLAEAATAAVETGLGALLIVPDGRDLARVDLALTAALGVGRHVALSADLGPAERYRRFLAVSRGEVRVVAGTRAAVFAPVAALGLVAIFDDGDDLFAEPRAPYPHAREVLMLRSAARSCALLVGGFARTAEAQLLVESGWVQPIVGRRADVRSCAPRIEAAGDEFAVGADSAAARARLSPAAFAAARQSLQTGAPVLVQVPRRGYLPVVACGTCRRQAQCRRCRGPLAFAGADTGPPNSPDDRSSDGIEAGQPGPGRAVSRAHAHQAAPAGSARTRRGSDGTVAGAGPGETHFADGTTVMGAGLDGTAAAAGSGGPIDPARRDSPAAAAGPVGALYCRWCGRPEAHFRCAACGSGRLRAVSIGAGRTAEEIGRAFPGVPVVNSSGKRVRATVADGPSVVVATPGAEPLVASGYGAALLLDGAAMLGRPDLRAGEETLRRWMAAAALVRSSAEGGRVVIGADASLPAVQSLIRWDPVGHAAAELSARRELGFPPAAAMASLEGDERSVLAALDRLDVPPDGEVLGPVSLDESDADGDPLGPTGDRRAAEAGVQPEPRLRALVRAPQGARKALSAALHAVGAARAARKEGGGLRIQVDPLELF